ncbi:MAG: transcription antitermination factor NusB [Gammaproteobacteria bacterium]|nr:transcription antitermination factor NusB [Gammaproteobacteria bacterium]MDE2251021.1 transcription antitermination factor NusB [Gammaproteobacteria bacterium]
MAGNFNPQTAARALARRLAVQALYRWQLNTAPWQDLVSEFATDADMPRADGEYFRTLVRTAIDEHQAVDAALAPFLARAAGALDPVEHAVLLVAAVELQHQPQVPFRVVIDEAVGLARRFGATDGHKFVNGVLDRAARAWRTEER